VPTSFVATTQWLIRDAPSVRLRAHKIRIEVTGGHEAGRQAELAGPEVKVGSAPGCDLVLADPTVSRHHLTLRIENDRVRVMDPGSLNGSFVDGVAVRDAFARPDSHIAIGATTLRLAMLPDVVEIPVSARTHFGALVGRSPVMRRMFAILERAAAGDATILLEGETGTGKELAAEAIHEESARASGPFVVFDCSAVSPTLIESELFGHVRGSFTGATGDRAGAFEMADGGTLFLDEIGELSLDLQPKLLRALERLEVKRVGANQARRVDVRVVAATNRALSREVERGRFREDLFYRLAVIQVTMPPLREHAEDIPLLVEQFVRELGGAGAALPPDVVGALCARTYNGNVRELKNAVARALSLRGPAGAAASEAAPASGGATALPAQVDLSQPLRAARDRLVDDFEGAYLKAALERAGGNVTRAAELAGVNRKFIQRAMKRLGLRGNDEE
jgi:transcriptional regulator with GAF, ATPase, and Fis domain